MLLSSSSKSKSRSNAVALEHFHQPGTLMSSIKFGLPVVPQQGL